MGNIKQMEEQVYRSVLCGDLEIDQAGRVWRLKKRQWDRWQQMAVSRPCKKVRAEHDQGQYLMVRAMINGKRYHAQASRLVYRHFYGPIPEGLTINHKDGKKKRNVPNNLETATYTEQMRHCLRVLKRGRTDQWGEKNAMAKLTDNQVFEIRERRKKGERLVTIAKDYGIVFQTVSKIAKGISRQEFRGA